MDRRILWSLGLSFTPADISAGRQHTAPRSSVELLEDKIIFESSHYDHEDGRRYTSKGVFTLEEYSPALQALLKTGRGSISSSQSGHRLEMNKKREDMVAIDIHGDEARTPAGRSLVFSGSMYVPIDKLQFE